MFPRTTNSFRQRTSFWVKTCVSVLLCLVVMLYFDSTRARLVLSDIAVHSPAGNVTKPSAAASTQAGSGAEFLRKFELDYAPPAVDLEELSKYQPHNYKGLGNPAFATLFGTRNGSLADPNFVCTQELVFRILWADDKRSDRYPVVVFVLPFVSQLQRRYLTAAGAIVQEVELREFKNGEGTGRYRDQFAKLNMWKHTEYSDIFYLDADALPWKNMDAIFETPVQRCNPNLLPPEDRRHREEICDYRFAAWVDDRDQQINAGVMLLRPNKYMFERLLRGYRRVRDNVDWRIEQGFLNDTFADPGPFPRHRLGPGWNGGQKEGETSHYVVHAKVWALTSGELKWLGDEFRQTWRDMVALYESPEFARLRQQDGRRTGR